MCAVWQVRYSNGECTLDAKAHGAKRYYYGGTILGEFHLEREETITKIRGTIGAGLAVQSLVFHTSRDRVLGPYGKCDTVFTTERFEAAVEGGERGLVALKGRAALHLTRIQFVFA